MGTKTVNPIVIRDVLSERYAAAFEVLEMETKYGQTVLTGDRINGLGLKLVSFEDLPKDCSL